MVPGSETGWRRRFVLLRTLGEGSFGSVFLADMEGAGGFRRRVALKLLNRNWDPSSDAGRRLRDEARLLGRLQHRNIVRVEDLVRVNGQWALLMEYVGGADLEHLFLQARQRGLHVPPRAATEIAAGVASALDAAWSAVDEAGTPLRVIHRDIKPSNVRLAENGDLKVLDFGVARADFAGREARTDSVRYGSLGYMPPERLLSAVEHPASDVYALGVVLYELLTLDTFGRAELTGEPQAVQVQAAQARVGDALGDEAGVLVDLLGRMLAFDPEARPSAGQVEAELRAASRLLSGDDLHTFARVMLPRLGVSAPTSGDPVEGTVLEETVAFPEPAAASAPTPRPAPPPERASGTIVLPDDAVEALPPARGKGWLVALAAVVVIGFVGFGVLGGGADAPETAPAPSAAPSAEARSAEARSAEARSAEAPSAAPGSPPPAIPDPETTAAPGTLPAGLPAPAAAAATGPAEALARAAPRPARPAAPAEPDAAEAAAPPAEAPAEAAAPADRRVRAAKFSITGAEGISVRCGDVSATGATNALVREFPAGPCAVEAGGRTTTITVDAPRGVACAVEGEQLACR